MTTERIKLGRVRDKVMTVQEWVSFFRNDLVVGASGFAKAGHSKVVVEALAERAKNEDIKSTLLTGASLGHDTDGKLASAGALKIRMHFQVDRTLRNKINAGEVLFIDQHLSESAELLDNKN